MWCPGLSPLDGDPQAGLGPTQEGHRLGDMRGDTGAESVPSRAPGARLQTGAGSDHRRRGAPWAAPMWAAEGLTRGPGGGARQELPPLMLEAASSHWSGLLLGPLSERKVEDQ